MKDLFNYIKEVYRYRELIISFSTKEITVKYKQTILGLLWAIIRPFISVFLFTYLFSKIGKLPNNNIPYPIIVLTGVIFWQAFSTTIQEASMSIVSNSNLITKVYFPRLVLPLSTIFPAFFEGIVAYILFIVYALFSDYSISFYILLIPPLLLINQMIAFVFSIFLSAVNVRYRDVKHLIPFLIQFGVFITPVAYLSNLVPGNYKLLLYFNPVSLEIDIFRFIISGERGILSFRSALCSFSSIVIVFIFSIKYFIKSEKEFSDYI